MIGDVWIAISISVQCRKMLIQMQDTVALSKSNHCFGVLKDIMIPVNASPVNPSRLIVLTITVIIAILAVSKLIPCIEKRRPLRRIQKP